MHLKETPAVSASRLNREGVAVGFAITHGRLNQILIKGNPFSPALDDPGMLSFYYSSYYGGRGEGAKQRYSEVIRWREMALSIGNFLGQLDEVDPSDLNVAERADIISHFVSFCATARRDPSALKPTKDLQLLIRTLQFLDGLQVQNQMPEIGRALELIDPSRHGGLNARFRGNGGGTIGERLGLLKGFLGREDDEPSDLEADDGPLDWEEGYDGA